MPEEYGDLLNVPGTSSVSEVKPADILASYARFTQKGVTIAKVGGGALIPAGTVLGRVTATKKYVAYTDGATGGAGSDAAVGILRQSVNTVDGEKLGNVIISGIVKRSKCVGLTAGAIGDLNGREDVPNDLFIF